MESLRAFNFTENALPKLPLTANQLLSEKEAQLQANNDRIKELEEALAQYAKHAGDLEILTDQVSSIEVRKTAPVIPTDATVYVEGWVRHDRVDKVIEAIKETTDILIANSVIRFLMNCRQPCAKQPFCGAVELSPICLPHRALMK